MININNIFSYCNLLLRSILQLTLIRNYWIELWRQRNRWEGAMKSPEKRNLARMDWLQ
jgi:hypothetical protein